MVLDFEFRREVIFVLADVLGLVIGADAAAALAAPLELALLAYR